MSGAALAPSANEMPWFYTGFRQSARPGAFPKREKLDQHLVPYSENKGYASNPRRLLLQCQNFCEQMNVFWGKCESFANKCKVSWGHAKLAMEHFSGDAKVDKFLGGKCKSCEKTKFRKVSCGNQIFVHEQCLKGIQKCCEGNAKDLWVKTVYRGIAKLMGNAEFCEYKTRKGAQSFLKKHKSFVMNAEFLIAVQNLVKNLFSITHVPLGALYWTINF